MTKRGELLNVRDVPRQRLFTLREAAEYLGLERDTVRKRVQAGMIPAFWDETRYVIKIEDLERYVEHLEPAYTGRGEDSKAERKGHGS